jgi:hypothetical protein
VTACTTASKGHIVAYSAALRGEGVEFRALGAAQDVGACRRENEWCLLPLEPKLGFVIAKEMPKVNVEQVAVLHRKSPSKSI